MTSRKRADARHSPATPTAHSPHPPEVAASGKFLSGNAIVLLPLILAGAALCITYVMNARSVNGADGFPLDDPWIHLQFARNLHDFGSFSYYRDQMVTSGSTSPLYTFILAAGFFLTSNEMLLSYVIGGTSLIVAAWLMYGTVFRECGENRILAAAASLLLLMEPRLLWVALSGMETTLYIALLLAAYASFQKRRPYLPGLFSGLLVWVRPDALLFLAAIGVDAVYRTSVVRAPRKNRAHTGERPSLRQFLPSVGVALVLIASYGTFNLLLSGSVLPNTYAAKLKYYSSSGDGFPGAVFGFVTAGHWSVLSIAAGIGALTTLYQVLRRRPVPFLTSLLWPVALFLAYWWKLPFLYQEGRYLMPVLPFIVLLGLFGLTTVVDALRSRKPAMTAMRWLAPLVLLVACGQFAVAAWEGRAAYAETCAYISDRQVTTARWMRDHLPADAVIGTHDVGAIGFYAGHRVVDMVGLVSPDMITNIGNFEGLRQFLASHGVTHLAVLRNWFEVANQTPLFHTNEQQPEIMEVFSFDPATVVFVSQTSTRLADGAEYLLSRGELQRAAGLLRQSMAADPRSARPHVLMAQALFRAGRLDEAAEEVRNALALHPSSVQAMVTEADIQVHRNNPDSAIAVLQRIVRDHPDDPDGYQMLARAYILLRGDSLEARAVLDSRTRASKIQDPQQ